MVDLFRLISSYHLADIKRASWVLFALYRDGPLLVETVVVKLRVACKHLAAAGVHRDEVHLAHAFLATVNGLSSDDCPGRGKGALAHCGVRQFFGGGHVHRNRPFVILGSDIQRAVTRRVALVVFAGFRTVDVPDCIVKAILCLVFTDKVNRVC